MLRTTQRNSTTLASVQTRFEGILHSFFVEPVSPQESYPNFGFGRMHEVVLLEFLAELKASYILPELGALNLEAAKHFSLQQRFEFEGALIQLLLGGTATRDVVSGVGDARETAQALLQEIVGAEPASLLAYRLDDEAWSELSSGNTLEASFCVYVPEPKLWWILVLADDY
ncbi:hypothetical protein [Ideonella paludis]|uniref:Uncharacterized protein n=1 Tax=Ideonella paludis TaxID=1233411 RepID=A0ABS5DZ81_9BURK|nr:hypothetical protein [Ideonella paludis]MBQ0936457.1 hypothetical protein [Ideonella paludis]